MAGKTAGAEWATITPAQAKRWLSTRGKNRAVSDAKVLEYAIAMESDKWSENGESIKFDHQGNLIDGQHRLEACILAGKSFRSLVVNGIRDEMAFATIDTGKVRTISDVFSIEGFARSRETAATVTMLDAFDRRIIDWTGINEHTARRRMNSDLAKKMKHTPVSTRRLNREELLDYAERHAQEVTDAIKAAYSLSTRKLLPRSYLAAAIFLLKRANKPLIEIDRFLTDLCSGVGLASNDPVYVLRERLLQMQHTQPGESRNNRWIVLGWLLKTWNARREGRHYTRLLVRTEEAYPYTLV